MNNLEQIFKELNDDKSRHTIFQLAEQTALEFTKWKDENYVFRYNKYITKRQFLDNFHRVEYACEKFGKTSEQLFNKWKNKPRFNFANGSLKC